MLYPVSFNHVKAGPADFTGSNFDKDLPSSNSWNRHILYNKRILLNRFWSFKNCSLRFHRCFASETQTTAISQQGKFYTLKTQELGLTAQSS